MSYGQSKNPLVVLPEKRDSFQQSYPSVPEKKEKLGRFGRVFKVKSVFSPDSSYVIKQQLVKSPHNISTTAYRELRILEFLSEKMKDGRCSNFITLRDWNKCTVYSGTEESPEPLAAPLKRSSRRAQSSKVSLTPEHRPSRTALARTNEPMYVNFVLEDAGDIPLSSRRTMSCAEFRAVVFQLLFGLFTAQSECNFMHNDLHLGNIIIRDDDGCQTYHAVKVLRKTCSESGDSTTERINVVWETRGISVKMIDFGHSRISLPSGEEIYNPNDIHHQLFNSLSDVEHLSQQLRSLSITDITREEAALKTNLLKTMRSKAPGALIHHPFFEPLVVQRPVASSCQVVLSSSMGIPVNSSKSSLSQSGTMLSRRASAVLSLSQDTNVPSEPSPNGADTFAYNPNTLKRVLFPETKENINNQIYQSGAPAVVKKENHSPKSVPTYSSFTEERPEEEDFLSISPSPNKDTPEGIVGQSASPSSFICSMKIKKNPPPVTSFPDPTRKKVKPFTIIENSRKSSRTYPYSLRPKK